LKVESRVFQRSTIKPIFTCFVVCPSSGSPHRAHPHTQFHLLYNANSTKLMTFLTRKSRSTRTTATSLGVRWSSSRHCHRTLVLCSLLHLSRGQIMTLMIIRVVVIIGCTRSSSHTARHRGTEGCAVQFITGTKKNRGERQGGGASAALA
jgi:hypothetical protein